MMKRAEFTIIMALVLVVVVAAPGRAQPPHLVNYQGVLADSTGAALDGAYDLTFRLYEDSLSSTESWTEEHTGVDVQSGLFNVVLGYETPLVADEFVDGGQWLGIEVDGQGELRPRLRITSVPYALHATVADTALAIPGGVLDGHSLDAHDGTPADVVYVDDAGNVAINGGVAIGGGYAKDELFETPLFPGGKPPAERKPQGKTGEASAKAARGSGTESPVMLQPPVESPRTPMKLPPENGLIVQGQVGIGTASPAPDLGLDVAGILQATGFRLPTGPAENFVLTSIDTLGNASWQPNYGKRVPEIVYADLMPGLTAGQQIAAAIDSLPDGGMVDARGFSPDIEHIFDVNFLENVKGGGLTLLLGHGVFTVTESLEYSGNGPLALLGQGKNTVLKAGTNASLVVVNASPSPCHIADLGFDLGNFNATAVNLMAPFVGCVVERIWIWGSLYISTGIALNAAYNVRVHDVVILSGVATGIDVDTNGVIIDGLVCYYGDPAVRIHGNANGVVVTNSLFENCFRGIWAESTWVVGISITQNRFESGVPDAQEHIKIVGPNSLTPAQGITIRDNHFTGLTTETLNGVHLKDVRGAVIERNSFKGNNSGHARCVVFENDVSDVFMTGNAVYEMDRSITNYDIVPLMVNDVTVTQSSTAGAFGSDLHIGGVVDAQGFTVDGTPLEGGFWEESAGDLFYLGGPVGIGTSVPTHTLEVSGSLGVEDIFKTGTGDMNFVVGEAGFRLDVGVMGSMFYAAPSGVQFGASGHPTRTHINNILSLEVVNEFPAGVDDGDLCVKDDAGTNHIYCYLNGGWVQLD